MIAVLDPAWLVRTMPHDEAALATDINALLKLCRDVGAELSGLDDYWDPLTRELLRPLESAARSPQGRDAIAALRGAAWRRAVPPFGNPGRVRGVHPMFAETAILPAVWGDRMGRALLRLSQLKERLILLTRPVVGRNIRRHGTGDLVLDEVTRWRVYAQPNSTEFVPIACVRVRRQVLVDWTTRYDHRLPAVADGARYPFCPPDNWDDEQVEAVQTRSSKPAFVDARVNGWTRPNIPGGRGYHWDVFVKDQTMIDAVGVDQINVVEFGAPPAEGKPGHLHHVPSKKAGKVSDIGWSCP